MKILQSKMKILHLNNDDFGATRCRSWPRSGTWRDLSITGSTRPIRAWCGKMVSKDDEFAIENEELCVKNDEFCRPGEAAGGTAVGAILRAMAGRVSHAVAVVSRFEGGRSVRPDDL